MKGSAHLLERALLAIAVLLVVAVGVLYLIGRGRVEQSVEPALKPVALGDRAHLGTVQLYFGARDRIGLAAEPRSLVLGPSVEARLRSCVRELAHGSLVGNLPVIPPDTRLRGVFLDPWGMAYLDFDESILSGGVMGDGEEWLAVAAIVRTVCDNFPQLREVRFLIEGHVIFSLGGYIDLEEPLRAEDFPLAAVEAARTP
jgi:spore germination protein GerM